MSVVKISIEFIKDTWYAAHTHSIYSAGSTALGGKVYQFVNKNCW